jgi:hypothetical protein
VHKVTLKKGDLVTRQMLKERQELQGSIDAMREINADLKEQVASSPLCQLKAETQCPSRVDIPFDLPAINHGNDRWTSFFDMISGWADALQPTITPEHCEDMQGYISKAREVMASSVVYKDLGPAFTDAEEKEMPDMRPADHLMAPLTRGLPRIHVVQRCQGRTRRTMVVSATAFHELVYRFPSVDKIEPSDVASVISRMQGLNLCNVAYNTQSDGEVSRDLSSLIHDTAEYFLAWHYHNVEANFQDPWGSEVSLASQPGVSGSGLSQPQNQPASRHQGSLASGISSVKSLCPSLSRVSPIYGFVWYTILLSLIVVLCRFVLVPWLLEPLCQSAMIEILGISSGLSASVSALMCPRWMKNMFGRFVLSCATGFVRTLFRSIRETCQDLMSGLKDLTAPLLIKLGCVKTTNA